MTTSLTIQQQALIESMRRVAMRVSFSPIDQPGNIQRETINVKADTDIPAMYAVTGCRVIEIEPVTA